MAFSVDEPAEPRTLAGGPGASVTATLEIKRSRFLAHLERVETEDGARTVVARLRAEHRTARHHCSAFRVTGTDAGQRAGSPIERSHDDGEPSGTAGMPILDVLRGRGLVDVVCIVTRYFGGTLLGAGGLVRAYGDATVAAVEAASFVRRRELLTAVAELDHADAGRVEALVRAEALTVLDIAYRARAVLTLALEPARLEEAAALVAGATRGRDALVPGGSTTVDVPA